jgi:hypothetical protein
VRGELRASATERGGIGEAESVIVCAEGILEATALSVFAAVMIFMKSKNSDELQISMTCLITNR